MDYEVNRVRSISSSPQVSPQGSPEPPLEVLNPENDEIQIIDKDEKKLELVVKEELETQDPKWHCFCCDLPRKTAVLALTKIILFMAMVSYIIYQLAKYFNTNINRREYTKEVLVDTVPFTYIYFAFAANNTICNTSFGFYNGTEFRVTEYFHYYEMTPNMTISDLFDYVDNENDCKGAYVVKKEIGSQYLYVNYLFVPSACDTMRTDSQDVHFGRFDCFNDPKHMPEEGLVWYAANHRDQLQNFETVNEAIYNLFWKQCSYIRLGLDALFAPKWITFDNEIDDGTYYDRLIMYTDHMEPISIGYGSSAQNSSFVVSGTNVFRFHTSGVGSKFVYVTEASIDILDVLGLAGGMYSTVDQILNYMAFMAIWGFSIGFIKFGGVAKAAGAPNQMMKRQLDGFLMKRDAAILELKHRIQKLEMEKAAMIHLTNANSPAAPIDMIAAPTNSSLNSNGERQNEHSRTGTPGSNNGVLGQAGHKLQGHNATISVTAMNAIAEDVLGEYLPDIIKRENE